MRFDLTPGSDCRVKVLNEVPDFRIARLEGRNGIGKTMAIRLLQLCTGDQPYRASEETVWRELKKALGSVSIRCSGLSGAMSVEWEVDSSLWPAEPVRTFDLIGDGDRPGICKSVTIDGKAADLAEVQELLRVHRLAGDETLAEAILADVSDLKAIAESERAVTNLHRGQAGGVLELFDGLLEAAAPETLANALKALEEAEEERDKLKKRVIKTSKRHEKLKEFAQRRAELSSLLEKHDDPEAHAGQLEEQLDDLRKQQELLRAERDLLNLDVGRDEQTLKEIDKAETDLALARQEREKLLAEGHELVAKLGLVSLPAGPKEPAILAPQKKTEEMLSVAREAQAAIDSAPQVVALGNRVLGLLDDAEVAPIRGRPIATLSEDQRKLSAADLEAGIKARQTEIADEGRPPQSEQLAEEIKKLEGDLDSFSALTSVVRKVKLRDTKIIRGREKLGELADKLSGSQGQRFAELETKQQELAQQATDLDAERMRVLQQMQQIAGGESTGTLLERLERNIAAAGTTLENLEADISEKGREVVLLTQEL
jgi:chromosome segregation ATPase